MLGNFTFHNSTKLYFGENSLENLSKELGIKASLKSGTDKVPGICLKDRPLR